MEEVIKDLVGFAARWALDLEIQRDVNLEGKNAHRLYSNLKKDSEITAVDFFFVVPEEEKIVVCVPSQMPVEGLMKTYGVGLEKMESTGFYNDATPVCMKADRFDLKNVLCREFVQHLIVARTRQFGIELHARVSGNTGGCGGV